MVQLDHACGHSRPYAFGVRTEEPETGAGRATLGGLIPPRAVVRVRVVPLDMTWQELGAVLARPCEACA